MSQKILVVDDDREWNLLLKIHIEKAGFTVAQAFNGREAMEKIAADTPALVILDINMPVMDGWEVCQTLRGNPATENLPIMILSSYSQVQDIQRGKSFRVKRYLLKPCLPQTVVQNVRDIFTEI